MNSEPIIAHQCPNCEGCFSKEQLQKHIVDEADWKVCPECNSDKPLVRVLVFPDNGKTIHITTKDLENILKAFSKEITGDDYDFEARNFAWEKVIQKERKAVKGK